MMCLKRAKQYRFTDCILLLSLFVTGGFYEYFSCALSAAMSIWLLVRLLSITTTPRLLISLLTLLLITRHSASSNLELHKKVTP